MPADTTVPALPDARSATLNALSPQPTRVSPPSPTREARKFTALSPQPDKRKEAVNALSP